MSIGEQPKIASDPNLLKLGPKSPSQMGLISKSIDSADPTQNSIFKAIDDSLIQMVQRYSRSKLKKEQSAERISSHSPSRKELIGTNFWKDPEVALGEIMKCNEKDALENFKSRSKSIMMDPHFNVAHRDIKFLKKKVVQSLN